MDISRVSYNNQSFHVDLSTSSEIYGLSEVDTRLVLLTWLFRWYLKVIEVEGGLGTVSLLEWINNAVKYRIFNRTF
jgi:hypothetical protein